MATCTFAVGTADSGGTPNTSGAFTPALNDLLIVLGYGSSTVENPAQLTSSIGGFTFSQIAYGTRSGGGDSLYVFASDALVSSAISQTVTLDMAGDPAVGTAIFVYRVSDMSLTGTSALRQFDTNFGGSATLPRIDFASAALTGNPTLVILGNVTNPAGITPPTNWTAPGGGDIGYETPTSGAAVAHRDNGFTSTGVPWGANSATAWGTIGVELDASAGSALPAGRMLLTGIG